MTRSRTLRPSFFSSFSLAKVTRDARLFFEGLWVEADDEGRLIDSPKQLAGAIFPHDDDVTPEVARQWIDDLVSIAAVRRYEAKDGKYLVIPGFAEHQKPPHPTASKLPEPTLEQVTGGDEDAADVITPSSRSEQENGVSSAGQERGVITEKAALGLGLGLGSGLCSGSGLGPGAPNGRSGQRESRPKLASVPSQPAGDDLEDVRETLRPLVNRWADLCRYRPRAIAEARLVIPELAKHIDERFLDERIGNLAKGAPYTSVSYLVAACRNWAAQQHPPFLLDPDPMGALNQGQPA